MDPGLLDLLLCLFSIGVFHILGMDTMKICLPLSRPSEPQTIEHQLHARQAVWLIVLALLVVVAWLMGRTDWYLTEEISLLIGYTTLECMACCLACFVVLHLRHSNLQGVAIQALSIGLFGGSVFLGIWRECGQENDISSLAIVQSHAPFLFQCTLLLLGLVLTVSNRIHQVYFSGSVPLGSLVTNTLLSLVIL